MKGGTLTYPPLLGLSAIFHKAGSTRPQISLRTYLGMALPDAGPQEECHHHPHPTRRAVHTRVCGRLLPLQGESSTLGRRGPNADRREGLELGKTGLQGGLASPPSLDLQPLRTLASRRPLSALFLH